MKRIVTAALIAPVVAAALLLARSAEGDTSSGDLLAASLGPDPQRASQPCMCAICAGILPAPRAEWTPDTLHGAGGSTALV